MLGTCLVLITILYIKLCHHFEENRYSTLLKLEKMETLLKANIRKKVELNSVDFPLEAKF